MMCSHLSEDTHSRPYEPAEWSKLAEKLLKAGIQPCDLTDLSDNDFLNLGIGNEEAERIRRLLERGGSLAFELEKYKSMGISVVTRADAGYPKMLKSKLGKSCPPLFYYAGNLKLAARTAAGFVGSRSADKNDQKFTEHMVDAVNRCGYIVVSGGAKGIDTIAGEASLYNGSAYIAYLSDSMVRRIRNKGVINAVRNGNLLLLSAFNPDAGFSVGNAMGRNRYIYAQSAGTVVVRSEYQKGGTWSGAFQSLKYKISPVFCWDNPSYKGNQELIKLGAVPITEEWDGNVSSVPESQEQYTQLSLFD